MVTCKDCFHYELCKRIDYELEYHNKSIKEAEEELPIKCPFFKNEAEVVPVVRCSQCRKRYTTKCALWYATLNDQEYFVERGEDFYCSYGEKK